MRKYDMPTITGSASVVGFLFVIPLLYALCTVKGLFWGFWKYFASSPPETVANKWTCLSFLKFPVLCPVQSSSVVYVFLFYLLHTSPLCMLSGNCLKTGDLKSTQNWIRFFSNKMYRNCDYFFYLHFTYLYGWYYLQRFF